MRIEDDAMERLRAAAHLEALKRAATLLVDAYARGETEQGVKWEDLDDAFAAARSALALVESISEEELYEERLKLFTESEDDE